MNDCSIYVALFPCNECAKLIIQSGIREIIYVYDKYAERLAKAFLNNFEKYRDKASEELLSTVPNLEFSK